MGERVLVVGDVRHGPLRAIVGALRLFEARPWIRRAEFGVTFAVAAIALAPVVVIASQVRAVGEAPSLIAALAGMTLAALALLLHECEHAAAALNVDREAGEVLLRFSGELSLLVRLRGMGTLDPRASRRVLLAGGRANVRYLAVFGLSSILLGPASLPGKSFAFAYGLLALSTLFTLIPRARNDGALLVEQHFGVRQLSAMLEYQTRLWFRSRRSEAARQEARTYFQQFPPHLARKMVDLGWLWGAFELAHLILLVIFVLFLGIPTDILRVARGGGVIPLMSFVVASAVLLAPWAFLAWEKNARRPSQTR